MKSASGVWPNASSLKRCAYCGSILSWKSTIPAMSFRTPILLSRASHTDCPHDHRYAVDHNDEPYSAGSDPLTAIKNLIASSALIAWLSQPDKQMVRAYPEIASPDVHAALLQPPAPPSLVGTSSQRHGVSRVAGAPESVA